MIYIYDDLSFKQMIPVLGTNSSEFTLESFDMSMIDKSFSNIDAFAGYMLMYLSNGGSLRVISSSAQYNIDMIDRMVKSANKQIDAADWRYYPDVDASIDYHLILHKLSDKNDYIIYQVNPFEMINHDNHRLILTFDMESYQHNGDYNNIVQEFRYNSSYYGFDSTYRDTINHHLLQPLKLQNIINTWIEKYSNKVIVVGGKGYDNVSIFKYTTNEGKLFMLKHVASMFDINLHPTDIIYHLDDHDIFERIIMKPHIFTKEEQ